MISFHKHHFLKKSHNAIHATIHDDDDFSTGIIRPKGLKGIKHVIENAKEDERDERIDNKIIPLHEKLSEHYDFNNSLHQKTIDDYSDGSLKMNKELWDNHLDPKKPLSHSTLEKRDAVRNLVSTYKSPTNFNVYSGLKENPHDRKNAEGIVHHPGVLATSIDTRVAEGFAAHFDGSGTKEGIHQKHILVMKVKKGQGGLAYIAEHSKVADESEAVFKDGLNIKLGKTRSIVRPLIPGSKLMATYHYHHGEIV
jgi:hypothetical protein